MQRTRTSAVKRVRRHGATTLEMSFCLMMFLTVTMGTVDLGIGVFRYHVVSQAARHAARQASVRGELASPLGIWGPNTIDVNANASGIPVVDAIRNMLVGCDLSKTQITVEWPNGNELDEQVKVTVSSKFKPTLLFIFPNVEKTLSATSTMRIAH